MRILIRGMWMGTYFMNKKHEDRLFGLMAADSAQEWDTERISLFYIISGNDDLYSKRNAIYNFKEHSIKRCLEEAEVDFSSGMCALIRLGFNLYNGYRDCQTTPLDLFWNLDEYNRRIAENAIRLRFDKDSIYQ